MSQFVEMDCCPITGYALRYKYDKETQKKEETGSNSRSEYMRSYYKANKKRLLAKMKNNRKSLKAD